MDEYKKLIGKFVEDIEKLDMQCDFDKLNTDEQYLFYLMRACRNKLIDIHNKIGDDDWVMPDMELR